MKSSDPKLLLNVFMSHPEEPVRLRPEQMAKVLEAIDSKLRGEPRYTTEQVMASLKTARDSRKSE